LSSQRSTDRSRRLFPLSAFNIAAILAVSLITSPAEAQRKLGRSGLGGSMSGSSASQSKSKQQAKKPASRVPRGSGQSPYPKPKGVNPGKLASAKASARKIDVMIKAAQRRNNIESNPPLNDSQFVRRAYLEITGTIPSLKDSYTFIKDKDSAKREKLIDKLISSEGYVSTNFNFWGNLLRVRDRLANNNNNVIAQPYHEWLKSSLRKNTPYDTWVKEMMTADGKIWDNPAVGFMLRDSGMELDSVNHMVRTFLGTRIGCAQCHDHPFDEWTQKQFYQMAAFMYGTRTRRYGGDKMYGKNPVSRVRAEMKEIDPDFNTGGDFNRILQTNFYTVFDQPSRKLRLPHDYQYDDAKPKSVVNPATILGKPVTVKKGQPPRDALADWLIAPDNPRFTRTIANRLWAKAMGVGLIEPVDDIQSDSRASIPALMKFLETELVRLDFDMKEFMRIIYNTNAWQRQATPDAVNPLEPYYYPGPTLRRMTAEQAWDSLLTLAVYNVDSFRRTDFSDVKEVVDVNLKDVSAEEIKKRADEFKEKYGNGAMRKDDRAHSYKGMTLARASELPIPVPANHFLRQFGQGDRELIDTASTDGSVSQVLTMFNGQITHMMLENGSVIYDNVMRGTSFRNRVEIVFLSILNRFPTKAEMKIAQEEIMANRKKAGAGFGNVIWALVNTKEFLFIQ
jgi:hypothetical protein